MLDPTCGSGAFLFAALNILAPLYDACLERMEAFISEADRSDDPIRRAGFQDFRAIRAEAGEARDYYIYKRIILDNLYGVDIMEEAVEICKLRLFLKLASELEAGETPEPLPDIDFNIRAGNTLVGFTTLEEVRSTLLVGPMNIVLPDYEVALRRVEEQAALADETFQAFRRAQEQGTQSEAVARHKQELRQRLEQLSAELDRYHARLYGIEAPNVASTQSYEDRFKQWRDSHQPFHWLADFYGVMRRGGFDVIIGNPPWIEYSKVRKEYAVRGYVTESCGNLYGMCTERVLNLRSPMGSASFIVQLPLVNSARMAPVRELLRQCSQDLYVATFDDRPGKLFDGLQHCRSTIFISRRSPRGHASNLFTTRYQRWPTESRPYLFAQFEFARILGEPIYPDQFPKYANAFEDSLFRRVKNASARTAGDSSIRSISDRFVFYQEATQYWVKATVGLPYYDKNGVVGPPAHGRYLYLDSPDVANAVAAALNSSLFYAYFIAYGDCFHLSDSLVRQFPVSISTLQDPCLAEHGRLLMIDLEKHAERQTIKTRDGDRITYAEFVASRSKPIIDEIDRLLAGHYGFTDEELDFVINYDIKYRMGQDAIGDSEDSAA